MNSFEVELLRVRRLSTSTLDFRFRRTDGGTVGFVPGQFFRFVFQDSAGEFERSYSLCNFDSDADKSTLDLVVSTVDGGRASKVLFETKPGLVARVSGPFGRLVLPKDAPSRLFLVATSVGIAPYMPMLEELGKWFDNAPGKTVPQVHFLYGARDHSEFVYGDVLANFSKRFSAFHVHLCLSRSDPNDNSKVSEYSGYVQERFDDLRMDPSTDHVLLCGNPHMVDEAFVKLKLKGFGVRQVVREKYVFAKDKAVPTTGGQIAVQQTDEQKQLIAEKMKLYQKKPN